jgi:hypothetical protein
VSVPSIDRVFHRRDRQRRAPSAATPRSPSGRNVSTARPRRTPERAVADGEIPVDAVLAAAQAVRTWHAAQRPARPDPRGLARCDARAALVAAALGGHLRAPGPRLVARHGRGAGPGRRGRAHRRVHAAERRPAVARAAALLGVDEVWAVGGAQAIAAMAYGTESIAAVDKIVGPGGGAVNTAKLLVSRDVAIDLPAGPSEIVVVADEDRRRIVQQEIDAQMEHGPDSRGFVVRVGDDLDAALAEVEEYAAEHVALLGAAGRVAGRAHPQRRRRLRGPATPRCRPATTPPAATTCCRPGVVALHRGPRSGSFMKTVTVQRVTKEGLERLAPVIEALAEQEGLPAHGRTARRD